MLDIDSITKLTEEFASNIKDPDFLEFLIQEGDEEVIDNFFAVISEDLSNYRNHKDTKEWMEKRKK